MRHRSHQYGLSPRVRGNPNKVLLCTIAYGSIPACAGEPIVYRLVPLITKVYPRVCGGTCVGKIYGCHIVGLSPRVRGNLEPIAIATNATGSIPACAGEPVIDPLRQLLRTVYPRVCGGTRRFLVPDIAVQGLSPRVRGNHVKLALTVGTLGSIPACAGEPRRIWDPQSNQSVYPRVCGGTHSGRSIAGADVGLSPRVRGNRNGAPALQSLKRSIPACAGEPCHWRRQ